MDLFIGSSGRVARLWLGNFSALTWVKLITRDGADVDLLVRGDTVYATSEGKLFAYGVADGGVRTSITLNGSARVAPLAADVHSLYVGGARELVALDPVSLSKRWSVAWGCSDLAFVPVGDPTPARVRAPTWAPLARSLRWAEMRRASSTTLRGKASGDRAAGL